MKILLDTHALIWLSEGSSQLSEPARRAIEAPRNHTYYSIASIWELAIKIQLGKLTMSKPLEPDFREELDANGVEQLAIDYTHVVEAGLLPMHHRDPFDRLLIAQANVEAMSLASHDDALDAYEVSRLW